MSNRIRTLVAGLLIAGAGAAPSLAFDGESGSAGDASRGYGAESYRAGAERSYSGAERFRSGEERFFRPGRAREDGRGHIVVFVAPPLGVQGRAGYVAPFGVDDARAGVYPGGFGHASGGSIVYRGFEDGPSPDLGPAVAPSGAQIIDVEAERLDARLIGPEGIDIVHRGGAKIIRLAPNYRLAEAERAAPPAAASAGDTELRREPDAASGIETWSEEWRRYCRRAHPDFDARSGLYRTAEGKLRFCLAQ